MEKSKETTEATIPNTELSCVEARYNPNKVDPIKFIKINIIKNIQIEIRAL